ncbi:hypothetical protein [Azoarcus sp. KH32C]|uniref:hypothetical protein n=1 Tax=Azoarcus sp. KH32C TaxID=748247 RepID=UPI0002386BCB|nr:hypothetical protein [Azoarcus sp. KH32C]BAL26524.1 hypothetical protein AZKH_4245 [Azoarcus sp. KH32C]
MRPIFAVLGARALGALAAHPASRRDRLRFFLMVAVGKKGRRGGRSADSLHGPAAPSALTRLEKQLESAPTERDTDAGASRREAGA